MEIQNFEYLAKEKSFLDAIRPVMMLWKGVYHQKNQKIISTVVSASVQS